MGDDEPKGRDEGSDMEERFPGESREEENTLGDYFAVVRKIWWKAALLSLAVGLVTFLWMLSKPDIYQARAVITPTVESGRANTSLGALAAFGIDIGGGASSAGDLETLFTSDELTVRIFRKHTLWPIVLGDEFDPATGRRKLTWMDRLFGKGKGSKPPGDWDAIRLAKSLLKVAVKKGNTVFLSVQSSSPEGSADILKFYLDEAKSRLQEEALDRAIRNNRFIAEQIGKTVDTLTRDRLYTLYGQEIEREMMARNREQFGFRVIDPPRVPDVIFGPARVRRAVLATVVSFFPWCALVFVLGKKKQKDEFPTHRPIGGTDEKSSR